MFSWHLACSSLPHRSVSNIPIIMLTPRANKYLYFWFLMIGHKKFNNVRKSQESSHVKLDNGMIFHIKLFFTTVWSNVSDLNLLLFCGVFWVGNLVTSGILPVWYTLVKPVEFHGSKNWIKVVFTRPIASVPFWYDRKYINPCR